MAPPLDVAPLGAVFGFVSNFKIGTQSIFFKMSLYFGALVEFTAHNSLHY